MVDGVSIASFRGRWRVVEVFRLSERVGEGDTRDMVRIDIHCSKQRFWMSYGKRIATKAGMNETFVILVPLVDGNEERVL